MTTTDHVGHYEDVRRRYNEAFQRAWEILPHDLRFELDALHGELLVAHEGYVLNHLVVAYHGEDFPALGAAISTAKAEPVVVDECDHRFSAAAAERLDEMGGPDAAEKMRAVARATLERDLGNDLEADRLLAGIGLEVRL